MKERTSLLQAPQWKPKPRHCSMDGRRVCQNKFGLWQLTNPFLWLPHFSFLTCCAGLHHTMALVPNLDPSHRICTRYINLQKESNTANKLLFFSLRRRKGITFPIVLFFGNPASYIILPGSMGNTSRNVLSHWAELYSEKGWQKKKKNISHWHLVVISRT